MQTSWFKRVRQFKSPRRVLAAMLLRSREKQRQKRRELWREVQRLKAERDGQRAAREQAEAENRNLRRQLRQREAEQQVAQQRVQLPADPPVGTHGYGARMISLCVNVAQRVGLRGAAAVVEIVFEWLGLKQKTPGYSAIRNWMQRVGVAALEAPVEAADDWIWMADHSNQIGQEKVLHVLGVRASQLPKAGEALRHEHVRTLHVQPGISWKREDMAAVYGQLAERCGRPRAVLVDGAVELREGAEGLKTPHCEVIVLRDFKHQAANALQALVGKQEQFVAFCGRVGQTRSAIQQTELGHLTPPPLKQKARFMNLAALWHWASVVLWLLETPEVQAREVIDPQRLEQKLGWLREFADDLAVWNECQQVICGGVTFINEQGLFAGAARGLRAAFPVQLEHGLSRQLAARLIGFVRASETLLKPGERLPMSTEILESSFSLYKQLERQHAKGGFTSLLAALPAVLTPATPESIRLAFAKVKGKDVKAWIAANLGATLTSKRVTTYREYTTTRATKRLVTT